MTPEHFDRVAAAMKEHARTLAESAKAEAEWRASESAVVTAQHALETAKRRLRESLDASSQADHDAALAEHLLHREVWEATESIRGRVAVSSSMVPDWSIVPIVNDAPERAMRRDSVRDRFGL